MKTIKKSISIDEDLYKLLEKAKKEHGTPFAESIRRALKKYFKRK